MQTITIAGVLANNAEECVDSSSRKYSRFTVTCVNVDKNGRSHYTHYNCVCYVPGYEKLKTNDQVFLTGKFSAELKLNEKGKPYMNLSVMVFQASDGFKAKERITK